MAYQQSRDPRFGGQDITRQAGRGTLITPANSDLAVYAAGLYVWEPGNLEIIPAGNTDAEILGPFAVAAGQIIPYVVRQVRTGTTATVSGLNP
jgi:hypothetical protein